MAGPTETTPLFPIVAADQVGWISTEQMVEVDRIMIDVLHIELKQMMENAGRSLARTAWRRFAPSNVSVFVGPGGNGGGGLVAARHLANLGASVTVIAARDQADFSPVARHQFDIIERLGIPVLNDPRSKADLLIDSLIGYSLSGPVRGRTGELVNYLLEVDKPVLALDTPSGLDTTSGSPSGPAVMATATMTLAMPKLGLRDSVEVGELYVADISVPPFVYEQWSPCPAPDFSDGAVLRVVD